MSWARLDDRFHDHPKVIAAGLEGAGLFTLCLTWAHQAKRTSPTPGVVPVAVVARFAGSKARRLAALLQEVGLFDETTPAGYPIHDFEDYLPRYDSEQAKAAGAAGGKARAAAAHRRRRSSEPLSEPPAEDEAVEEQTAQRIQARTGTAASAPRNPEPVPEPEPDSVAGATSSRGGSSRGGTFRNVSASLPARCSRHAGVEEPPPCGACAEARKAAEAAAEARREARPVVGGATCPDHPGQPAARCPDCARTAVPMPADVRAGLRRRAS